MFPESEWISPKKFLIENIQFFIKSFQVVSEYVKLDFNFHIEMGGESNFILTPQGYTGLWQVKP